MYCYQLDLMSIKCCIQIVTVYIMFCIQLVSVSIVYCLSLCRLWIASILLRCRWCIVIVSVSMMHGIQIGVNDAWYPDCHCVHDVSCPACCNVDFVSSLYLLWMICCIWISVVLSILISIHMGCLYPFLMFNDLFLWGCFKHGGTLDRQMT